MKDGLEAFRAKFVEIQRDKFQEMEARFAKRTPQDFQELGEVFHCHLMVEDALVNFIKSENPKIGDFEKGASLFSQKLIIAQNMKNGSTLLRFNKSLQALNEIRNKLGHYPVVLDYPQSQVETLRSVIQEYIGDRDVSILPNISVIRFYSTLFCTYMSSILSLTEVIDSLEGDAKAEQESYISSLEGIIDRIFE